MQADQGGHGRHIAFGSLPCLGTHTFGSTIIDVVFHRIYLALGFVIAWQFGAQAFEVFNILVASGTSLTFRAINLNPLVPCFIVTGDGVMVINGSASYLLAKALHDEIKVITDQPVKLVFNENGQGHAMLGNGYWAELGVPIVAQADAGHEFDEHGYQSLEAMKKYNREKSEGTVLTLPSITFEDEYIVEMGDFRIEILNLGPSHSPGDAVVWLPAQKLVIAGDMAFHERMLPIFEDTITADWLETWDGKFEKLGAVYVILGHGHPTNMAQVRRYTRGYLIYLRGKIGALLEDGGTLAEAYYVDQSPYAHLDTYKELATKTLAGFMNKWSLSSSS